MHTYLKGGSAQTTVRAATLREKVHTNISVSFSPSMLTPGQPVLAMNL